MNTPTLPRNPRSIYVCFAGSLALLALIVLLTPRSLERAKTPEAAQPGVGAPAESEMAQSPAYQTRLIKSYGKLPLSFEANFGQAGPDVRFLARGTGYSLFLTNEGAALSLPGENIKSHGKSRESEVRQPASILESLFPPFAVENGTRLSEPQVLRVRLVGANPRARVVGVDELPGKSNYFLGNDSKKWRTNVPNYARTQYKSIYPGVDLTYYGNQGNLEYDFIVTPGADPGAITLAIDTSAWQLENRDSKTGKTRIDANGDLVISMAAGEVRFRKPVVYQPQSAVGSRQSAGSANHKSPFTNHRSVEGRFALLAENRVGFKVGEYDKTLPLVIDPELIYSTYLGGTEIEVGLRIAVDSSGSAYVTGAAGPNFPTTIGQLFGGGSVRNCSTEFSHGSFPCPDAFVTKLSPDGTTKVYSTYLGGYNADVAAGIRVDSSGNAYVTGSTASTDFPTTSGVLSTTSHGKGEVFVAKLNPNGLLGFSTYLGGASDEVAFDSALDGSGNTYITGITFSSDFATAGAYKTTLTSGTCVFHSSSFPCPDAFVAKVNNTGTALSYATYLGGSSYDAGLGIAVGGLGGAWVTGTTISTDFPLVAADQGTTSGGNCGPPKSLHPCADAFISFVGADGSTLGYSSYLGGSGDEIGTAVATDFSGALAYVAGITNSTDFPTTAGAAQPTFGGGACGSTGNTFNCPDAFVAKIDTGSEEISYSTYLGGSSYDGALGIALFAGNAYVVGATGSIDFPTAHPTQDTFGGGSCSFNGVALSCPNAFLTRLNSTGSAPIFSTYHGGAGGDIAFGVGVDGLGNAYLTGSTVSADFPTAAPLQANLAGKADLFVAKMSTSVVGPGALLTPAEGLSFDPQLTNSVSDAIKIATLTNNGDALLTITGVPAISGTNAVDFGLGNNCGSSLFLGESCTIGVTFKPTATGNRTATLTVTDNGPGGSQSIPLFGTGTDVTIEPASGSSTLAEVAAGATATYDLTFTPDGFVGSMALACTGAPTAATCTPSPGSLSLDGTTPRNVTVSVTTASRSLAAPPDSQRRAPPLAPLPLIWLGWLAMLTALVAIRSRRVRLRGLTLGMTLLFVLIWEACGNDGTPAQHGTPPGTYTLTLTGTAGTVTRSIPLTLTVR